ncbi:hypothetical protein, partial [Bacillus cereus]|uniref:hypothetical protein n=1 Tax=Bacillus cereus TaxID=1396 RepID=UPI003D647520
FPLKHIFFFHTDHAPFLSCSTSMTKLKFERPFSNHLAFLHQNLFTPSRQTKSKAMPIDLDSQVYEPNGYDHSS